MNKRLANIVKEAISQDDIASKVINETPKAKTKEEWSQWSKDKGFNSHEFSLVLMYARKFGLLLLNNGQKVKSDEDRIQEEMAKSPRFRQNPD